MKRYEFPIPRAAFALAAVALTAMTLGLTVLVPSRIDTNAASAGTVIGDAPTRVERIDVIAVRQSRVASMHGRTVRGRRQEG